MCKSRLEVIFPLPSPDINPVSVCLAEAACKGHKQLKVQLMIGIGQVLPWTHPFALVQHIADGWHQSLYISCVLPGDHPHAGVILPGQLKEALGLGDGSSWRQHFSAQESSAQSTNRAFNALDQILN